VARKPALKGARVEPARTGTDAGRGRTPKVTPSSARTPRAGKNTEDVSMNDVTPKTRTKAAEVLSEQAAPSGRSRRTTSRAGSAEAEPNPVATPPHAEASVNGDVAPSSVDSKRRSRKKVDDGADDIDELSLEPGFESSLLVESVRTRRPLIAGDEEVTTPESSYFELWLEKPAGEDPDDLDDLDDVENSDDEADAGMLEALSNPTPHPGRWNPDVQLTSADYNDRNQELFARRNELLARIATQEAKRRRTRDSEDELRRTRFELDTVTNDIVSFNYGLVLNYTRKFTSTTSKDDSADFEAAGVVGLMRAVKSYDPTRGTKFSTWAYKPIQREILKAVRDADFKQLNPGDFEKRPEILRAVKALQNGNEEFIPTFEAVAVQAGATLDAVKRILNAPVIESLSAPMGEEGDSSLTDLIEDPAAGVEDTALARQEIMDLEQFGLSCLDERELFVIGRRFGLDGEPPQRLSAIGTLLGLSREAVRQVEAKALSKLLHPVTRRRLVRHGRR
jgi:RNA polymerase sigma factor (sigma-70 family)